MLYNLLVLFTWEIEMAYNKTKLTLSPSRLKFFMLFCFSSHLLSIFLQNVTRKKEVKLWVAHKPFRKQALLNNLCVSVTKTTLLLACLPPRVSFIGQCHAYVNTHTHTHSDHPPPPPPPWIFDNPNWIPLLGARRRFSTVLTFHRPWLSCKIVFSPSPER